MRAPATGQATVVPDPPTQTLLVISHSNYI
jgi:hypothetical protein